MPLVLAGATSGSTTLQATDATTNTLTLPAQTAALITDSSAALNIGSGQIYKDASGNVGIGTTSPSSFGGYSTASIGGANKGLLTLRNAGGSDAGFVYCNGTNFQIESQAGFPLNLVSPSAQPILFTNVSTERMRIDSSGNLLVGCTANTNSGGFILYKDYDAANSASLDIGHITGSASGNRYTRFQYAGSTIGSITQNGTTGVTYGTTSDYRLKENVAPMIGALDKVAQLKPVTYTWKSDGSDGQGFIAHELQAVVPDCVTGEKDAVDAEGNPVYQGIDTSFLVATLTAAIQELNAKVDAQSAEIAALKGIK